MVKYSHLWINMTMAFENEVFKQSFTALLCKPGRHSFNEKYYKCLRFYCLNK